MKHIERECEWLSNDIIALDMDVDRETQNESVSERDSSTFTS